MLAITECSFYLGNKVHLQHIDAYHLPNKIKLLTPHQLQNTYMNCDFLLT